MSTAAALAPTPAAGGTRSLLRLEALALLGISAGLFQRVSGDWILFAELFLLPDLSMVFYIAGPRAGAVAYNAAHSTLGPLALAALSLVTDRHPALALALIWLAHIGFDRMLGYGLKLAGSFSETHLGRIGRKQ